MINDEEGNNLLQLIFNRNKAPEIWNAIDKVEEYISGLPNKVWGNVEERGTLGLYSREITLPSGTLLTSMIHKTHHQFVVSEGAITVYNTVTDITELYKAGHHGITYPGTRRVLYTHLPTKWVTFHPTDRIKLGFDSLDKEQQQCIFDEIMGDLLQCYYNPLLTNFDDGVYI